MASFVAFLTHVFFSLSQEEEKNLKKINFVILHLFLILLVIIQIIYIYLLHAYYSPRIFFCS